MFHTGRTFRIRNKNSGLYLNLQGYSKDISALTEQFPLQNDDNRDGQVWFVIPIEKDQYLIKNKRSGHYLNAVGNGAEPSSRIEQYPLQPSQAGPAQNWQIRYDHQGGAYTIQNRKSGLFLNIAGYSVEESAHVELYYLHDAEHRPSQLWEFEVEDE